MCMCCAMCPMNDKMAAMKDMGMAMMMCPMDEKMMSACKMMPMMCGDKKFCPMMMMPMNPAMSMMKMPMCMEMSGKKMQMMMCCDDRMMPMMMCCMGEAMMEGGMMCLPMAMMCPMEMMAPAMSMPVMMVPMDAAMMKMMPMEEDEKMMCGMMMADKMPSRMTTRRKIMCGCGCVEMLMVGEPKMCAICHCDDCQKASGAPCVANAYFDPKMVKVTKGMSNLVEFKLKTVPRMHCKMCHNYMYSASMGMTAVNGNMYPSFQPTMHVQCKFAKMKVKDAAPKYLNVPKEFGGDGMMCQW